ncbi:TPA: hypothetical protein ACTEN1_002869 [Legionella pneumophila]|nr:hypothetical protein [Fluoribacter dumoffii]
MTKIYGQMFLSKNGSKDSGAWFDALNELTPKALESGVARLRNLAGNGKFAEYPPNCLQFKALCMAFYDDLGLPKARDAYQEITNSIYKSNPRWSHPLIEFIAQRLPENFFSIEQEAQAFGHFSRLYTEVCHLVKQGHELPESIKNKRAVPTRTPSVAHMHLQQIKHHIGA